MKNSLVIFLSAVLITGPVLPALAADATIAPPAKVESSPVESKTAASDAPDLPNVGTEKAEAPEDVTQTAKPEVPQETLAVPGKVKPDEPESHFKMKNFALGFLGGVVVGGAAGILFFSRGDNGFDQDKAKVMGPVGAAVGGLAFGLAAMVLGATTPEDAKPPKVESQGLPEAPQTHQVADISVHYNWTF